ncbi:MAG: ATPase, partial [Rhodospirillales bacterium]|nr:ATPase [Rhodospirillales bacterium]
TLLLGQPQFRATMASPDMEQLRQRVLASYHLGPLDEEETRAYISHRLARVGWGAYGTHDPEIEDAAFAALHAATGGIPRRINTLMGRVLLGAALAEQHRIDAALVEETAQEWRQDLGTAPTPEEASGTLPAGTGERLARLEAGFARQERIFRRLLALLSGAEGRGDGGEA